MLCFAKYNNNNKTKTNSKVPFICTNPLCELSRPDELQSCNNFPMLFFLNWQCKYNTHLNIRIVYMCQIRFTY